MTAEGLTIMEVAAALKISRASVYRLIAGRKLATTDVGTGKSRRTRVTPAALARYLAKSESSVA